MSRYVKALVLQVLMLMVVAGFPLVAFLPAPAQAFPGTAQEGGQGSAPAATQQMPSGKVVETMTSGGYTYICLEKDGVKSWAAVPKAEVKVGQQVVLREGAVMTNFTSKTLNRTFENILFSGGLVQ